MLRLSLRLFLLLAFAHMSEPVILAQTSSPASQPSTEVASAKGTEIANPQRTALMVGFTGDLMGFYRDKGSSEYKLPDELRKQLADQNLVPDAVKKQLLLVGMGNNFGPEFIAALQTKCPTPEPNYGLPVDAYKGTYADKTKTNDRIASVAECDNVTHFLIETGYRAIVPGRYDYLYGTRWLRDMASHLQTYSAATGHTSLHLLAANLVAAPIDTPKRLSDKPCPLLFDPQDWGNRSPLDCDPSLPGRAGTEHAGYELLTLTGTEGQAVTVLIIGVVDPEDLSKVAARQDKVCIRDGLCAKAAFTPPACAIRNILGNQLPPHDYTLILAQLSPADTARLSHDVSEAKCADALQPGSLPPGQTLYLSRADSGLASPLGTATFSNLQRPLVLTPNPAVNFRPESAQEMASPFTLPLNVATIGSDDTTTTLDLKRNPTEIKTGSVFPATEINSLTGGNLAGCASGYAISSCNKSVREFLVSQLIAPNGLFSSAADFAFLKTEDFYLQPLPQGYDPTIICADLTDIHEKERCRLISWLDVVLWRGDFKRKVAIKGDELRTILKTSAANKGQPEELVTFGINKPSDGKGGGDLSCPDEKVEAKPTYCINGKPIKDEDTYWAATTDDLVEANPIYPIAESQGRLDRFMLVESGSFLTTAIARRYEYRSDRDVRNSGRFQVDLGRVYLGYSSFGAEGNDAYAKQFQGVDESRAYAASYKNLDFEGKSRVLYRFGWGVGVGVQGEAEYATTRKGSLADQTKNISWLMNTWQAGPFVQFDMARIFSETRHKSYNAHLSSFTAIASWSRVQDIEPTLFYESAKDSAGNSTYITADIPRKSGEAWRTGVRIAPMVRQNPWLSFGSDTYAELDFQATQTRNVVGGMRVTNALGVIQDCFPTLAVSMQKCIDNLSPATDWKLNVIPVSASAKGPYWDINLTWKPLPSGSLTVASNGYANVYVPSNAPTNQALFSIPLSIGVQWAIMPNLTVGPSWTQYLFRAQQPIGSGIYAGSDTIRTRTTILMVKWYFSRRTAVPAWRQIAVAGPASADETSKAQGNAK